MKPKHISKIAAALLCTSLLFLNGCQVVYIRTAETEGSSAIPQTAETRDLSQIPEQKVPGGTYLKDISADISDVEASVNSLYKTDLNGNIFMTVIAAEASDSLYPQENDVLSKSIAVRNSLISEYYGSTWSFRSSSLEDIQKDLAASIRSGTIASYYADLLEVPALSAGSMAVSGMLLNLRQLPFYVAATRGNTGCGYYGSKTFFDAGAGTERITDNLCLYFSLEKAGAEVTSALYDAVFHDAFTFERFAELVKACGAGTASGSAAGEAADLCSCADAGILGQAALIRSGFRYTDFANGARAVIADADTAAAADRVLDTLLPLNLLFAPRAAVPAEPADTAETAAGTTVPAETAAVPEPAAPAVLSGYDVFAGGNSLFYLGRAAEITELSSEPVRWGLLPLPKAPGEGSQVVENRSVFCVPANNTRLEMTGVLLTAVNSLSGDWMTREFSVHCTKDLLRDNNSYFTLAKVLQGGQYCDFAYLYAGSVKNLEESTFAAAEARIRGGAPLTEAALPLTEAVNKAINSLK